MVPTCRWLTLPQSTSQSPAAPLEDMKVHFTSFANRERHTRATRRFHSNPVRMLQESKQHPVFVRMWGKTLRHSGCKWKLAWPLREVCELVPQRSKNRSAQIGSVGDNLWENMSWEQTHMQHLPLLRVVCSQALPGKELNKSRLNQSGLGTSTVRNNLSLK